MGKFNDNPPALPEWGGHAVLAYGYYSIPSTDHEWFAVRDTWKDGFFGPYSNWEKIDNNTATWMDLNGTEWWPTPGSQAVFLQTGETGFVASPLSRVVVITPGGLPIGMLEQTALPASIASKLKSVFLVDDMSRGSGEVPDGQLDYDVSRGSPECVAEFCYSDALASDAIRLFSPDGSQVGFSVVTLVPEYLGVYFDYLATLEGKIDLYLDDHLLQVIMLGAGPADSRSYEGIFDVAALGLSPDTAGVFKLVLSGRGDPEVYIDNLLLGSAASGAIPEPATLTLLALGGLAGLLRRRSRR
jgi:hypothetical protein